MKALLRKEKGGEEDEGKEPERFREDHPGQAHSCLLCGPRGLLGVHACPVRRRIFLPFPFGGKDQGPQAGCAQTAGAGGGTPQDGGKVRSAEEALPGKARDILERGAGRAGGHRSAQHHPEHGQRDGAYLVLPGLRAHHEDQQRTLLCGGGQPFRRGLL